MTRDPAWLTDDLEGLKRSHLLRPRRLVQSLGPGRSLIDGLELVDFSTNDYLGLARDSRLILASSRHSHRRRGQPPRHRALRTVLPTRTGYRGL